MSNNYYVDIGNIASIGFKYVILNNSGKKFVLNDGKLKASDDLSYFIYLDDNKNLYETRLFTRYDNSKIIFEKNNNNYVMKINNNYIGTKSYSNYDNTQILCNTQYF